MSNEYMIRLLLSKSCAYKAGYVRATASGDSVAAKNFKKGYQTIKEQIYDLKRKNHSI